MEASFGYHQLKVDNNIEKIAFYNSINTPYGTKQCQNNNDCGWNMECLEEICYCIEGFIPVNNYCKRYNYKEDKS
jgi:hypothetical protein